MLRKTIIVDGSSDRERVRSTSHRWSMGAYGDSQPWGEKLLADDTTTPDDQERGF